MCGSLYDYGLRPPIGETPLDDVLVTPFRDQPGTRFDDDFDDEVSDDGDFDDDDEVTDNVLVSSV